MQVAYQNEVFFIGICSWQERNSSYLKCIQRKQTYRSQINQYKHHRSKDRRWLQRTGFCDSVRPCGDSPICGPYRDLHKNQTNQTKTENGELRKNFAFQSLGFFCSEIASVGSLLSRRQDQFRPFACWAQGSLGSIVSVTLPRRGFETKEKAEVLSWWGQTFHYCTIFIFKLKSKLLWTAWRAESERNKWYSN